jgi:hypothetical protein
MSHLEKMIVAFAGVTRLQTLISFDKFLSTFSKGRGPNSASKENVLKPLSVIPLEKISSLFQIDLLYALALGVHPSRATIPLVPKLRNRSL